MSSSHFATSFSAAAAQKDSGTSNHSAGSSTAGSGGGGSGSADWSRRVNGNSTSNVTRRPSLSTTLTHPTAPLTSSSNVYHPPHHYNRLTSQNTTYGKEELLNIFKSQEGGGGLSKKLPELLDSEFTTSTSGWGRSGDEVPNGLDLCWEKDGGIKPIGLEEMTEDERELFLGNVNSTHKAPNNNPGAQNHNSTPPQNRKNAGVGATPGANRPTTRRRETSDAAAGGNPFAGTPPQISRRRTELRDGDDGGSPRDRTFFGRWGSTAGPPDDDQPKEKEEGSGGTIGRNTGLFRRGSAAWGSSGNTASSFSSSSALNSPMGTFGNGAFGGGAMGGFTLQTGDKTKTSTGSKNRPGIQGVDERAEEQDIDANGGSDTTNNFEHEDPRDRPTTSDTDPFGLGGSRDNNPQQQSEQQRDSTPGIMDQQQRNLKTSSPFGGISISTSNPPRSQNLISTPTRVRQDLGFASFGGSREGLSGMSGLQHQLQNLQFNDRGQVPLRRSREGSIGGTLAGDNEPLSPAETNPFMSPPPEKADEDNMQNDHNEGGGGLGSVIAGLRRGEAGNIGHPGSDRSGRSSTAGLANVGGPLGGFGGLGGSGLWGSTAQLGTPGGIGSSAGQSSFFGSGNIGDISSPAGGPVAGSLLGGIGSAGFGSAGRASRLGQLFPENMQQQQEDHQGFEPDEFGNESRFNAFGSRRGLGGAIDSPMRERGERGDVADLFGFPNARSFSNLATTAAAQENTLYLRDSSDPLGLGHPTQGSPPRLGPGSQAGPLRPPPGTQHVMVMPDKIQWVYRDPSGTVQGPFSGLEMHEWYRAGFFTQDLAVKRVEDSEFEQLGVLVRKIGNTREPFLVPLPGNTAGAQPPAQTQQTPGGMQPPFAGSFPTFGTTLTAEQQNALERRKQEEQYLMAKQREFLLQQQMMAKQAAVLHHQSSTQSLHSQPSFGSLHSPSGFASATTPAIAAGVVGGQNAFEPGALLRQAGAAAGGVDSLNMGAQPIGSMQAPGGQFPQQQDQVMQLQQQRIAEQQRQQLYRNEQTQYAQKQLQVAQEQAAQQAHLKQQYETDQYDNQSEASLREQQHAQEILEQEHTSTATSSSDKEVEPEPKAPTPAPQQAPEQPKVKIPKAPAAATKAISPPPAAEQQQQQPSRAAAWGQVAPLVQPFPPPPSQDFPSQAVASPSVETPSASVAPWAKEEAQSVKGPSLKEIQELEAKQAAAREAAEAQARREMLALQATHQPPPPAPGLPSTATWATSPSATPIAWNKTLAKPAVKTTARTLQQIQKEEEVRKAKLAASQTQTVAAGAAVTAAAATASRGYAGVASKTPNPPTPAIGIGAWTTVGPGGKHKGGPLGGPPTAPTAPGPKVPSAASFPSIAVPPKKPVAAPIAPKASAATTTSAQDEFNKWCRATIKSLNPGYTTDSVIDTISSFPSEPEIIADTIYTVSNVMDGRRWAEEYIKRREAAGNGVIMDAGTASAEKSAGGWNEVAKGRPAAAAQPSSGVPETNNAFRVVAGKKKGRRA